MPENILALIVSDLNIDIQKLTDLPNGTQYRGFFLPELVGQPAH